MTSVLTHEEIEAIEETHKYEGPDCWEYDHRAIVHAVIDATIKRLSAGVSVEPFATWHETDEDAGAWARASRPVYELKQLQTAIAAARVQALEEAEASVRKAIGDCDLGCAAQDAIRALLGKEAT